MCTRGNRNRTRRAVRGASRAQASWPRRTAGCRRKSWGRWRCGRRKMSWRAWRRWSWSPCSRPDHRLGTAPGLRDSRLWHTSRALAIHMIVHHRSRRGCPEVFYVRRHFYASREKLASSGRFMWSQLKLRKLSQCRKNVRSKYGLNFRKILMCTKFYDHSTSLTKWIWSIHVLPERNIQSENTLHKFVAR